MPELSPVDLADLGRHRLVRDNEGIVVIDHESEREEVDDGELV